MIDHKLQQLSIEVAKDIVDIFQKRDDISQHNSDKVLKAFWDNKLAEHHLHGTTGYGYNDSGREIIEKIYAQVFGGQDALVRHTIVSGTHALSTALFGILRPGDTMLSVTGKPYDTLDEVIGIKNQLGSLADFGINYKQLDFKENKVDLEGIKNSLSDDVKLVFIQRSKGYQKRPTLCCSDIKQIADLVHSVNKNIVVMIDNCYGEFVEKQEPLEYGADLIVGSLIKNPGGGLAQTGGYIVGNKDLIEKCAYRLTAPGIGKECGATLDQNRFILQGLFLAPVVTNAAVKTAIFAAALFEKLGFKVSPKYNEERYDIIGIAELGSEEQVLAFCTGIQKGAPVDSFAVPEGWDMPGYDSKIVMAAGAFVSGASIELSADAPLRPPFNVFFQGGLTYESGKTGILMAANEMLKKGYIKI